MIHFIILLFYFFKNQQLSFFELLKKKAKQNKNKTKKIVDIMKLIAEKYLHITGNGKR